jgi:Bacterial PH domain
MGSVPVGRKKRTDTAGGPQTFRSPTAVVVWWVWVLFAAANLVDLAIQGRDHLSLVAAAVLVLVTGVAYVAALRPRIVADDAGVTVVNPLRNHHVGWANVIKVDLADLLRVHCRTGPDQDKVVHAWAVHYSRRRQLTAEAKTRRQAARVARSSPGTFGLPSAGTFGVGGGSGRRDTGFGSPPGVTPPPTAEADAERIATVLTGYATAARAEEVWADGTAEQVGDAAADPRRAGWLEPLTSTWDPKALLSLLVPALIVLVVALI